jgi:hypothetical protein
MHANIESHVADKETLGNFHLFVEKGCGRELLDNESECNGGAAGVESLTLKLRLRVDAR